MLWRTDVNAHGDALAIRDAPVTGRVGVGYTLLGGRHVNDAIIAPTNNVLNALASVRYRFVEVGFDMYNVLGLKYADDEEYYVSNWSFKPGRTRRRPRSTSSQRRRGRRSGRQRSTSERSVL